MRGITPMVRAVRTQPARAITSVSCSVSTGSWPSNLALAGRKVGQRSRRVRVFSSASVKSSANQPLTWPPSMVLVVLRAANSGRAETSVVAESSLSRLTISAPSWLSARLAWMKSQPALMARS